MKKHFSVEVVRKQASDLTRSEIHDVIIKALEATDIDELPIAVAEGLSLPVEELDVVSQGASNNVDSITIYLEEPVLTDVIVNGNGTCNGNGRDECLPNSTQSSLKHDYTVHVFELDEQGEEAEYMDDNEEEQDQSAASHQWLLPSRCFHGMWDSLIFESDIKRKLLDYVRTAVMFSTKQVNPTLVAWNKVILLHGPPGTGKTSLCKALAQKAVIRLQDDFLYGQLVEINSHSLFSKWFSESGKLVTKMFDKILELVEDPKGIVFLLIDEVESLAQCRQSAQMGNEPTDSIRAVNALLTQIDRVKKYPNVLILTTSNIVGSIDLAFVDRADLKLFIGHPPPNVVYGILASCINELLRVNLIKDPGYFLPGAYDMKNQHPQVSQLFAIAKKSVGLSGRTLRKLPFVTFASSFSQVHQSGPATLDKFLTSMNTAVDKELNDRKMVNEQDITNIKNATSISA